MPHDLKNIRLPLMVSEQEAKAIDDWRFAQRVASRAEAVRQLIARGLQPDSAMPDSAMIDSAPMASDPDVAATTPLPVGPSLPVSAPYPYPWCDPRLSDSETQQLNVRVPLYIDIAIEWLAQCSASSKLVLVKIALSRHLVATLRARGIDPAPLKDMLPLACNADLDAGIPGKNRYSWQNPSSRDGRMQAINIKLPKRVYLALNWLSFHIEIKKMDIVAEALRKYADLQLRSIGLEL